MSTTISEIESFILAGGKSSRMGSDKAMLILNGKTMLQTIYDTLNTIFCKTSIVSNHTQHCLPNIPFYTDLIPDKGPAGGIYTAMEYANSSLLFVVACDMPLIHQTAIEFFLRQLNTAQKFVNIATIDYQLHPLFAVYPVVYKEFFLQNIQENNLSMRMIISNLPCHLIDMTAYNESLKNVNHKEDFDNLVPLLAK
jgi:Molybdopterin-guanine dinucleotide biosynthesis protein A